MANGPVDFGTMLQMQGAISKERGFARMWSAGASDTVKAAYQQSADLKGKLAAENIRRRYFKKEFEQILETRVKPLQERLKVAKEQYDTVMATTTMPVGRIVQPDEYQFKADALGQGGPVDFKEMPSGSKEKPGKILPQQPAAPNAALGKEMGAMEYKESLALVDPVSGQPVPLSSPRGVNIWKDATNNFWTEYSSVNKQLMQVMSEYAGNPYADKYAENLIDQTIKQGNIAATGKADPMQAQEWMEGRQRFEAEQEARQQDLSAGRLGLEMKESRIAVDVRDAQRLVETDPTFVDLVGKNIADKFNIGKKLTRREQLEVVNAVRLHRDLQEKQIARRARERVFNISSTNLPNPQNWQSEMRTKDPVYGQYFTEEYQNFVNDQQVSVSRMPKDERENILRSFGANDSDIALFEEGGSVSPGLRTAFERMANSKQANVIANDMAEIRRLPELERQQPELAGIIDQIIEEAISQIRATGRVPNEDLLRADRYRTFFEVVHGREAPMIHDTGTLYNVDEVLRRQESELNRITPTTTRPQGILSTRGSIKPREEISEEIVETPGSRFEQALKQYESEHPESRSMKLEEERKRRKEESKRRKEKRKSLKRLIEKTPKHEFKLY